MKIIAETVSLKELAQMAESTFGNLVKAVVDIQKGAIAVDAELHSDLEALLLENGSKQKDLWGINLYPEQAGESFIEFDSIINIRPSNRNNSRGIESEETRKRIREIVTQKIKS